MDCHSPHASQQVTSFTSPLPRRFAHPQNGIEGVSGTDGTTVLNPSVNQYENCLRCHGMSSGKQPSLCFGYLPMWAVSGADPLNIYPAVDADSSSSHPVMYDSQQRFAAAQPANVHAEPGRQTQGRPWACGYFAPIATTATIIASSVEPGRTGRMVRSICICWNAATSSARSHPAFRGPGTPIQNLFPTPILDPAANGLYPLCAKCHDLALLVSNTSFSEHARHINDGFSCSTCHNAHGMGSNSAGISGERMVNFDIIVVAPNGTSPISYSRAANSCSLASWPCAYGGRGGGGCS